MNVPSISPEQLHQELQSQTPPNVLDVRELCEIQVSKLKEAVHIPLAELPGRMGELDKSRELVVLCRAGGRSAQAVSFLLQNGFDKVRNLTGGMQGWAQAIDPTLPVA